MKTFHENEDLSPMRAGDVLLMEDGISHTAVADTPEHECWSKCSMGDTVCSKAIQCDDFDFHFEQTKP